MSEHPEIERKYLLKTIPDGLDTNPDLCGLWHITQSYVESQGREVRLRAVESEGSVRYVLTAKSTGDLVRTEREVEISAEVYDMLLPLAGKRILSKIRYRVTYKGFVWEIDVFKGDLEGLVFAEVEMQSKDAQPEMPKWIINVLEREVTYEKGWSNSELTRKLGE